MGFSDNWVSYLENTSTPLYSIQITPSSDGKYRYKTDQGLGKVFVSSDYGSTWLDKLNNDFAYITSISITGQYALNINNILTSSNNFYTTSNYGDDWSSHSMDEGMNFIDCDISGGGSHSLLAVEYGTDFIQDYPIWVSSNYQSTFQKLNKSLFDNEQNILRVKCSETGQYMLASSDYIASGYGSLFISSNYGSTWIKKNSISGYNANSIDMSLSGRYMIAVYDNDNVYISSDFGITWNYVFSTATYINCLVKMSGTGQYCLLSLNYFDDVNTVYHSYIYSSSDYGESWELKRSIVDYFQYNLTMSSDSFTSFIYCWDFVNYLNNITYISEYVSLSSTYSISSFSSLSSFSSISSISSLSSYSPIALKSYRSWITHFPDIYDPTNCDPKYLPYISRLLGYDLKSEDYNVVESDTSKKRLQISEIIRWYGLKGVNRIITYVFDVLRVSSDLRPQLAWVQAYNNLGYIQDPRDFTIWVPLGIFPYESEFDSYILSGSLSSQYVPDSRIRIDLSGLGEDITNDDVRNVLSRIDVVKPYHLIFDFVEYINLIGNNADSFLFEDFPRLFFNSTTTYFNQDNEWLSRAGDYETVVFKEHDISNTYNNYGKFIFLI
jgi:hypothetical protein